MSEPEQKSSFVNELARRRVFRSAGAYVVVAWFAVQVGAIVFPEFGAPDWAMRALIILLIVSFPPAMLLAWTIDISGQGFRKTPDSGYSRAPGNWPRLTMVLVATAMSAGVLWWIWDDYIVQPGQTRSAVKSQPVVAVNAPRKLIGKPENEWLGGGIANMIRSELAESRHVIVLSASRWHALTAGAASKEDISDAADRIGVDYLIDGEYVEMPDGIVLTTHIEDVENGIEIHSSRISEQGVSAIIAKVPDLSIRIKQALRIPHQENVGLFEADFAIENVEAYEAYIAGLAYLIDFEYQAAESAFDTALVIAPDYHIARYRLALVYESTGRSRLARATLDDIPTDANLSERLRLYVEGAKAFFVAERDTKKAIEIYSELVELYPYETEAGTHLAEAYWLDFQDTAAVDEFRRLSRIHAYDPTSWMALGERLLDVGELDEAQEALNKYASMQPDDAYAFTLLGNLALLRGDLVASVQNHAHALELKPGFVVATIGLARSRYLQGKVDAAQSLWQSIVYDVDVAASFRIDAAFDLAGVLRGRGLYAKSLEPLSDTMELILEEGLRTAMALSQLGSTQLELGNNERARALIDESIEVAPVPATRYLFARGMMDMRLGNLDAADRVVAEIRSLAHHSADFDRNADKAGNYLAGLSALRRGESETAEKLLQAAVDQPGFQYAIYKNGLAALHREMGDLKLAAELAAQASSERDADDLRLDLELERARAQLLHAEILAQIDKPDDARDQAERFIMRWQTAAPDLPEVIRAKRLLATQ
jgi:tetratricopeptide (TPR) repeat protein